MAHDYHITEDDYLAGMRLAARRPLWRRALAPVLVAVALVSSFYLYDDPTRSGLFMVSVISAVALIAVEIVSRTLVPRRIRNIYANDKATGQAQSIDMGDDGLHISSSLADVTIPWDHVVKWREDDDYILTFSTPVMFQIIPKRLAEVGFDIEDLRNRLADKAGPAR